MPSARPIELVQGDLAQAQARNVSAVRDFLLEVLSAGDPAMTAGKPPGEVTVQEAVDAAASNMGTALDAQPETKVPILTTLADVYSSLDQVDRSIALLEQALVAAERSGPTPNRTEADVLTRLAGTNMFAGRFDAAAGWLDRAETAFAALGDTESEDYAQVLKMRGNLLRRGDSPDLPRAVAVLERAAALFRKRYPHSNGRTGTLFYLAQTLRAENQPDRAERSADEAVAIASELPRPGFELANAYSLRAAIRDGNGNLSGADDDYRTAHDGYARSVGPGHFLTLQNDGLLGATLLERGQRREEALQLIESTTDGLAHSRRGSFTHAQALNRLGAAYLRLGRFDHAAGDPRAGAHRLGRATGRTLSYRRDGLACRGPDRVGCSGRGQGAPRRGTRSPAKRPTIGSAPGRRGSPRAGTSRNRGRTGRARPGASFDRRWRSPRRTAGTISPGAFWPGRP